MIYPPENNLGASPVKPEVIERIKQGLLPKRGIYTVAYGAPARACAQRLLTSIEQHMPGLTVMIATDEPADFHHNPNVLIATLPRPDIGAREPKLRMYEVTPAEWQTVLYLDADVELLGPVDFLFDALAAGWDMVLTKNPGKYHTTLEMARPNNRDEVERTWDVMGGSDFVQWNGGVVGFRRSPAVAGVFERWLEGWREARNQDQPALHRAIFQGPVKVLTLGSEWNCSSRYTDGQERAVVYHWQTEAREMKGKLPPKTPGDSEEAWARLRREARR